MPKEAAIVFITHFFDAAIEKRFRKLRKECSRLFDVFLLAEAGVAVPDALLPETHSFDFESLRSMARSVIGEKVVPGNCHLRSIDFFRRAPGYRFYWFVEYDVVYSGNWRRFFSSFDDDASDLLAAHVRLARDDAEWPWASTFGPGADRLTDEERLIAFLPVHRISARGLEAVERKVAEGWIGHFEAIVPSALAHDGLSVADLGGSGAFTPADRVNRHYLVCRPDFSYFVGTLRCGPPIALRMVRNVLYHPCKTERVSSEGEDRRRRAKIVSRNRGVIYPYALRLLWLALRSRLPIPWRAIPQRGPAPQGLQRTRRHATSPPRLSAKSQRRPAT